MKMYLVGITDSASMDARWYDRVILEPRHISNDINILVYVTIEPILVK